MKPKDTFIIEYAFCNGRMVRDYREYELDSSAIDQSLLFLVSTDSKHAQPLTISLN